MRNWIGAMLAPCFLLMIALVGGCSTVPTGPLVLAAASMHEAINEAADAWAAQGYLRPVVSFAGSSALARQIDAGAPADLFISADADWMNDVAAHGHVKAGTRQILARNQLVLVALKTSSIGRMDDIRAGLLPALGADGKLAMADPSAVPAGKYGKAALTSLKAWDRVQDRVVSAENVRAALALVERGVAPLGVVYRTDAMASPQVRIVATFPDHSHPAIVYPMAQLTSGQNRDTAGFSAFLLSPAGQRILRAHGFASP